MIPIERARLEALRKTFIQRTGLGTPAYQITPRSPWPSELFALYALGEVAGVRTWLEGGTYHGQAAEVLAKASPRASLVTVEIDAAIAKVATARLAPLSPRVRVIHGDGRETLHAAADSMEGPIGVFLDGPKGFDAFMSAYMLIAQRKKVVFVGMHDMPLSIPGLARPARAAIDELGRYEPENWASWASDDEEYVAWAKDMDEGLHAAHNTEHGTSGRLPYERFAQGQPTLQMRSYGPTVTFLFRPTWNAVKC